MMTTSSLTALVSPEHMKLRNFLLGVGPQGKRVPLVLYHACLLPGGGVTGHGITVLCCDTCASYLVLVSQAKAVLSSVALCFILLGVDPLAKSVLSCVLFCVCSLAWCWSTGQIELFSHVPVLRAFVDQLKNWDFNICAVYILDAQVEIAKVILARMHATSSLLCTHEHGYTRVPMILVRLVAFSDLRRVADASLAYNSFRWPG